MASPVMSRAYCCPRGSDSLPRKSYQVSSYTIWLVLREAGWSWQKDASWCETGQVKRKRKEGVVVVTDPDATAKKT